MQDVRFGFRMLTKRPGTTTLAIIALALGIGLTTIMFSIVNGAFLRGLPFDHADRIAYVGTARPDRNQGRPMSVKIDDMLTFQSFQTAFSELGAYSSMQADLSADDIVPARYDGAKVTPNAWHILRVRPVAGRDFRAEDAIDGAAPVAMISDKVWKNQFDRAPSAVGRTIRINGAAATIVGIMPGGFGFPQTHDVWMPLALRPAATRAQSGGVEMFGRLADDASFALGTTQARALGERITQIDPKNKNVTGAAVPFVRRYLGKEVIMTLSTMLGAVFGVLLIACVNVMNLQLARAADRVREVGIRLAMGASRTRLVRQLLVEGLLLSFAGTVVGLAIAEAGVRLFMAGIADSQPPFWIIVNLEPTVLLFATGLTVVAALASSLVPALRVTRQDLQTVLKDAGRANTSLSMGRFTRVLVGAEIMLSFVLLVVSGLMIKSVVLVNHLEFPFRTDRFQARVELSEREYRDDAAVQLAIERIEAALNQTPGVSRGAIATALPDRAASFKILIDGEAKPAKAEDMRDSRRIGVTPEYFEVMGVTLKRGRLLDARDRGGQEMVSVVTEEFAKRFFPDADPIGHRFQLQSNEDADNAWWTIVGVVSSLSISGRNGVDDAPIALVPMTQLKSRNVLMLAAASGLAPRSLETPIRKMIRDFNADLPLFEVDTVEGVYAAQTWPFRVFGSLFMSFGLSALLLAAAGLYGVMAFSVQRRTAEIGVRMALGADAKTVLLMVMRQGALIVGLGIAIGAGLGGLLGGQMKQLLYNVEPWDPMVFAITIAVLGSAGLLASFLPARRAAATNPITALRTE